MKNRRVTICNELGMHARAASKLVDTAGRFESNVVLSYRGRSVNAKSIMGVLMLAAAFGAEVELEIDGSDEQQAMDTLVELIESGFGENDP